MLYSTRPNIVTLTQAQYDALSLEDKNNGTFYFISDAAALSQSIPCVTLTQAQYDALSTAEKNNGTVYFIIDGAGDGSFDLDDLNDVVINSQTLANGHVLKYDSTTQKWINGEGSGGASALDDLTDVSIDDETLADGQVLKYDSNSGDWINADDEGGGTASDITVDDTNLAYEADDVQEALEKVTKSLTYAEYQELTEEEKNNGTIYLITDINGDGQSFQPVIYSTDEREIGVWTDGRPVYEKTLNIGEIASNINLKSFAHGIENLDWIIDYSLFALYADETKMISPATGSNYTYGMVLNKWDNTNIYISRGNLSYGFTNTYCVIRYTKSTDTAGSGTWTPQGVPAVHYSTDEQVVGTWIDGSTLYERTLHSTATPTGGAWNSVPIGNVNVLSYEAYFIRTTGAVDALYESFDSGLIGHIRPDTTGVKFEYKVPSAYVTNFQEVYVTIRYTKSST